MRQRSRPAVPDDAAVVEDLLKLGDGGTALSGCEIRLTVDVGWIEAGQIGNKRNLPVLDWRRGSLQVIDRGSPIFAVERQLCPNRRQPERLHLRVQRKTVVQVLRQRVGSCRIVSYC